MDSAQDKRKGRQPAAAAIQAEPTETVAIAVGPVLVAAKHPGTYPRPGETYPRYRKRGEIFTLNDPEHFSDVWMKRMEPGEEFLLEESNPNLPQTTGVRARSLPAFPPIA